MYLLGLGLVFLIMKYLGIGAVASWDWWMVLTPFGLAVVWWAWADASGYTKKIAMEREDRKRKERIARNHEALGTAPTRKKSGR
ncbi:MAG: TIGR04438 family Trp-rich protein [Rhodoferax sp.]|uniref:TIGR04438 family Trp-rich protein n=1 Tax=Rhodoferax sp. TaxID=50421 RepID=UPI00301B3A5E